MATSRKGAAQRKIDRYGAAPSNPQRTSMKIVMTGFLAVFMVIAARLGQLHLNPSLKLTEEESVHIAWQELHAPRGEIFDTRGVLLATDRQVPSLWADPRRVNDPECVALVLSARLGADEDEILRTLSKRDAKGNPMKFVWLQRWLIDVEESVIAEILASDSGGGIEVQYRPRRYYPEGSTAAHLLGFVNWDGQAAEGLERSFDKYLRCLPGKRTGRVDQRRRLLPSLTLEHTEPRGGGNVHLTIDTAIQHTLERELDNAMQRCNAPRALGIVMDPYTGAIIALANRPAFDPNRYDEYPPELWKNRAALDVFEPGSSFKIVPAAAALEHGLITRHTLLDLENGYYNPYGHRVEDYHKFTEPQPFYVCFEQSSNIAMIKIAAMLGEKRMEQWIRRFGFGSRTSRDFHVESRGIFRPLSQWSGWSMSALPIGQEISVTMPQMARAFAAIANGGFLVEPYFVERAVDRNGNTTYRHVPAAPIRILSPSTAETMKELCHRVVMNGTGKQASIPEYRVGGKTGTAQMERTPEEVLLYGRGYSHNRYTTVFAGFAPINNPRLVAVIVVQEPMIPQHYGGYVCGPVFKEVVREALIQMETPEDPVRAESGAADTRQLLALEADADTVVARGGPAGPNGPQGTDLTQTDDMKLAAHNVDEWEEKLLLPDFAGMTKQQAKSKLWELEIPWDPQGAGWVVSQNPPPRTPLNEVALCALTFSNRYAITNDDPQTTY